MALIPIGKIDYRRRKRLSFSPEDKLYYNTVSNSFLAMFVGFVDGDGYISVNRDSGGYMAVCLVISLHPRDTELLNYMKSVLKIGTVRLDASTNTIKYTIYQTDLQMILFPLLLERNIFFLTNTRQEQYLKALLEFNASSDYLSPSYPSLANEYLRLPFFRDWVVGFTMAEGSFYSKARGEHCYSLRQRKHHELFQALKLLFNASRKVEDDGLYNKLAICSAKDVANVVHFFSFSGLHPLMGYKKVQYDAWIRRIRKLPRFSKIKFPEE